MMEGQVMRRPQRLSKNGGEPETQSRKLFLGVQIAGQDSRVPLHRSQLEVLAGSGGLGLAVAFESIKVPSWFQGKIELVVGTLPLRLEKDLKTGFFPQLVSTGHLRARSLEGGWKLQSVLGILDEKLNEQIGEKPHDLSLNLRGSRRILKRNQVSHSTILTKSPGMAF